MNLTALRARCRFYLNDPTTAANNLFSDADLDIAINDAYKDVGNLVRRQAPGWFQKLGYLDSTTSEAYAWPSDFIRCLYIRADPQGGNLSSTPTITTAVEIPKVQYHQFINARAANGPRVWTPRQGGFLLTPVFGTTGTDSIEIYYEHEVSTMSTGTDAPVIPGAHHDLIVTKAVILCLASKNMDWVMYHARAQRQELDLMVDLKTMDVGYGDQMQSQIDRAASYYDPSQSGVSPTGFHGDG